MQSRGREEEVMLLEKLDNLCLNEIGAVKGEHESFLQKENEHSSQRKILFSSKIVYLAIQDTLKYYLVARSKVKENNDENFLDEVELPWSPEDYKSICQLLARSVAAESLGLHPTSEKEGNGSVNPNSDCSFDTAGSASHLLGVRPENLLQLNELDDTDMAPLVSEVENRIEKNRQLLARTWQPSTDIRLLYEHNDWLGNNIQEALRNVESGHKASWREEEALFQLYRKYIQEQNVCLDIVTTLLKDYKFGRLWDHASFQMTHFTTKIDLLEANVRLAETQSLQKKYSAESVSELKHLKGKVDRQVRVLTDKQEKMKARLQAYESLGPDFTDLSKKYREVVSKLDNQRYLYEELSRDLGQSASESVGYGGGDSYYDDSRSESADSHFIH